MAEFMSFCGWLLRWCVRKPIALFFRTLRQELRRYPRRGPNRRLPR